MTIQVNNRVLQELQTEPADAEDPTVATAFVESSDGAEFSVHLLLDRGFAYTKDHLEFHVSVDGHWISGRVVDLAATRYHGSGAVVLGAFSTVNGANTLRKMRFASHETST